MKLSVIVYLMSVLLLTGCSSFSRDEQLVNNILSDHIRLQKKKNRLVLVASGYSMPEKVKRFMVYFISGQKLSPEQAWVLTLNSSQDLLALINENEEIRPFLDHYPFTESDIELRIHFIDEKGEPMLPPFIALAFMDEGKIACYYLDP